MELDMDKTAARISQENENKDNAIERLTAERDKAREEVSSLKREILQAYLLIDSVFKDNWQGVDGPVYNSGRLMGHADMCADLRAILDPEDKNHWNKDGLMKEAGRLVAIRDAIKEREMKTQEQSDVDKASEYTLADAQADAAVLDVLNREFEFEYSIRFDSRAERKVDPRLNVLCDAILDRLLKFYD